VLTPEEAAEHPHNLARGTFVDLDGHRQPGPAPKFDRTPAGTPEAPHEPRSDTTAVLRSLGYSAEDIDQLRADGVIA
jgi:alpha-methylacyl-CoA racemase